ncbi:NAD(P)H-quinone oxidoreductase subunit F [Anthocerotibacter panamensis]|uniref:NAD(P)H-quinone oxidoreductase subunit F n=1 Tax=Anthocerotibacter panamensis TaxID=2857077 RepID=UPI001C402E5D
MTLFLEHTVWLVPFYCLLGAVLTLPWAAGLTRGGPRPGAYINLLMTVLALVHALTLLQATLGQPAYDLEYSWLKVGDLHLTLTLDVSTVSVGAVVLITGLSFFAQLFALGYMEKDWGLARFFALMGFFEGAMCGLALSNSLLLSYGLLELLTLSTYLLVGFWYAQPLVVTAARDAFWTKRLGDLILLMGVVALSNMAPSLNFPDLAQWASSEGKLVSPVVITLVGLALIAGPTGKCAQFPLNLWLDEAMEGPNPASILRNSVVVACGAYILIKLQPVLALSPVALTTLIVLGSVTAVGACWVALAQVDIKRAFSHSTSAYLGLVFIAVGLQQNEVALLLLFAHALSKALLFMSVGGVIFTTSTQNVNELGGLWSRMPATTMAFLVASCGLVAGLPLGSLWAMGALAQALADAPLLWAILLLVNSLTALNLSRVYCLVFTGPSQAKTRRAPEVPWTMAVPMVSLMITVLLVPVMLQQWGAPTTAASPTLGMLMIFGGAGAVLGYLLVLARRRSYPLFSKELGFPWRGLQDFLAHDLYLERLYQMTVVSSVTLGSRLTAWIDRHIVDSLVNMVGLTSIFSGQLLRYTNSGRSQTYVLTILLGVLAVGAFELMHMIR